MHVAVASPFVDRQHGTERAVSELVQRLATQFGCEIDIYAQRVVGLPLQTDKPNNAGAHGIRWRHVLSIQGPHLLKFVAWYCFNFLQRRWDRITGRGEFDLVFSPGINCPDADVILVHAVFHRMAELKRECSPRGLRGLHQKLYYRLICRLERRAYTRKSVALAAVSSRTARQLSHYFGRDDVRVIPNGVDTEEFQPATRIAGRETSRRELGIAPEQKALLLIGNDWSSKGLESLLKAAKLCPDLPLRLIVVGDDEQNSFLARAQQLRVADRLIFRPTSQDILKYYGAADIVVAPSLEDSFNLPCLEAMACGLPVILSPEAGVSEWITAGEDAILLKDPRDAAEIAQAIRLLASDSEFAARMGEKAVLTAATLTWDRHAAEVFELLSRSGRN